MLKSIALFALLCATWASAQEIIDVLEICTVPFAVDGPSCTVFQFDFSTGDCVTQADLGALANGAAESVTPTSSGFGCTIFTGTDCSGSSLLVDSSDGGQQDLPSDDFIMNSFNCVVESGD
ncbi:hypothetical protein BT96DRAFT_996509 [Gymnopus androsaceus JB14]|uniref:Uncharacterized protein n=1 Tax=Gymnopus androsaceus JB14 TaxID=1447944 RepID=A0A6A4HI07_9AGAR|nr:hypothetical protein BT96DRAFT_996509 [Gymnopus androsaceus JB14]